MKLLTSMLLVLIFSRILGQTFKRLFNQPEIVGEILSGIILGGALLNWVQPTAELSGIAELAVFLVIFAAGLEMEVSEVFTAMRGPGLPIAILGFFVPLVGGIAIGTIFELQFLDGAVIGLCFAITALPVALRMLETMKLLETRLGHNIIGAAIIIDITALLFLGILMDSPQEGSTLGGVLINIGKNAGKMALFFALILGIDWIVTHKLKKNLFHEWLRQLRERFGVEAFFGVAVLFVMLFSSLTEELGFHFVIGAFFGGMLLSRGFIGPVMYNDIQSTLNSISTGFLAPIFFAYIGLQFSTAAFDQPVLLILVVLVGILSKTWGGWLGAKVAGLKRRECLAGAVILNGRGVMDLVVAEIALDRGIIQKEMFSALVIMSILSTFLTPVMYQRLGLDSERLPGNDLDTANATQSAT